MTDSVEKFSAFAIKSFRQHGWLAFTLAAAALIYRVTLLPGVGFNGDTAKFQFVGKILGTPHPTGYPTYIFLNHLFVSLFPLGSVAFRANLLSALFSLGAAYVLYRILEELGVGKATAAAAVLAFSLGKTVWTQSLIAEVYTLNLLFIALTVCLFLLWSLRRRELYFYLGCAVYAFSFGNHMTTITLFPALVYLVLAVNPRVFFSGRKIAFVLACIAASSLQYGYILWRSAIPEQSLYLETYATDLPGLVNVLTGKEFQGLMFTTPLLTLITQTVPRFGFFFLRELLIALPLPLAGFFLYRGEARIKVFLLAGLLGNLFFNLNYAIDDIYVYLIPAYFFLTIFSGMGLEFLSRWAQNRWKRFPPLVMFFLPLLMLVFNYQKADQSANISDDQRIRAVLSAVDQDALILTPGYDEYEYLNYYLFVDGLQRKNRINQTHMDGVLEYLVERKPFYGLSKFEPGELDVYVMDEDQRKELEGNGIRFVKVMDSLYRAEKQ